MNQRAEPGTGPGAGPTAEPGWILPAFLAACALIVLLFYREFVFAGDRMLAGTDMLGQGYQLRKFALDEIAAGRGLPLWNPYVNGGMPYLAILPGPLFYPSSLLYLVMPLSRAIGWTFVLHTFLGGAFAYFAGRSFGLGRQASAVCGTAFLLTGYVTSHLYGGHDGRMFAMALIPLAFGLLERGLRSGKAAWFVSLGVVVGLQILTPHVQVMYFSSLALALYFLFYIGTAGRAEQGGGQTAAGGEAERQGALLRVGRPVLLFGLAFAVGALLGAVQLLPTLGLLEHAVRGGTGEAGYAFASSYALPAQELTALFLPDLIGSLPASYWGSNPIKLHTEYMGIVPLALAGIAVVTGFTNRNRRTRFTVWFLTAASLLGIAFALGEATPVHRIAYTVVPMIKSFRAPAMMLSVVCFFTALLAGFGWQAVLQSRDEERRLPWTWILVLSAPFLVLGLAAAVNPSGLHRFAYTAWYPPGWPRQPDAALAGDLRANGLTLLILGLATLGVAWTVVSRRVRSGAVVGLLALTVLDLWNVGARYVETVDPELVFRPDHAAAFMAAELDPGERVWQLEGTYGPNDLMLHRVPSIAGVLNFRLRWWENLVGGLGFENLLQNPSLWGLFDLRFVAVRSQLDVPLLGPASEGEGKRVYEVLANPSHMFFPGQVQQTSSEDDAVRLAVSMPNIQDLAVIEVPEGSGELAGIEAGSGQTELVQLTPGFLHARVEADAPGLLFVSQIFHPDWRATLDGSEVPILRANVAFMGVPIPAGAHELELRFTSPDYQKGRAISLLALLAAVAYLLASVVLARRRGAPGPEGTA